MKKLPDFLKADYPANPPYDMTPRVLANLQKLGLDSLVAIGGDDTLSYAAVLNSKGFNVVGIPKTMDNDVRNTEYCIGFSTAISRAHGRHSAPADDGGFA